MSDVPCFCDPPDHPAPDFERSTCGCCGAIPGDLCHPGPHCVGSPDVFDLRARLAASERREKALQNALLALFPYAERRGPLLSEKWAVAEHGEAIETARRALADDGDAK